MGRVLMAAAVLAAGLVALAGATGTSTFAAALFAACALAFLAWQRLAPTLNVRVMIEAGLYGGAVLVIVTAAATGVRDNAFLLFVVWLVPWAFLAWGRGRATAYVAVLAVASAIVEWVHGEPGFSAFLRTDVPVLVVGMGGLVGVSIVVRMVVDRLADSQNATQWSAVCQACIADLARRAIEEVAADGALGREAVAMTRTVLAADRVELIAPGTPAAELPEPRDGLLLVPVGSPDGTAGHLVVVRDEHPFRRDERAFAQTVGDVLSVADRRIAAERERRELAGHDALTGLPGRERFTERLTEALSPSARADGAAVLVIDVDDFVLVNDTLGAVAGDALLCGVAGRLRRAAGESATVARLGADEFALLSPGAGRELLAVDLAKRVQTAMRVPFDVGEASQHVTVSTGIAVAARGLDAQGVLRDAHLAQRHARAQGRGRYEVFDRGLRQVLESRRTMEQELRHAIERGEFRLVYQPLVDISTGAICGAEALLRWHHPERGMVPPADFVPVAEATDLIVPIGAWALRQGLRQLKAWQDTLPGLGEFKLGINLSGRQLSDGRFVPLLRRQLAKYRIDPRRLTCELTETALTDESAQVEAAVEQIKALGVGLSLDDFGTGYASLRYVRRFAFDSLKLDRSFVAGLGVDADDTALVAAAVSMGQALNMTVVAEGVETPEQAQRLREMGCGLAQGFHFARPMEAGELRARLLGQVDAAVREPDPHPGPDSRIALQLEHAAQRFDPLARGR